MKITNTSDIKMRDHDTDIQSDLAIAKALYQELAPLNLRYYITSYGCQMNAHDSENMAGLLESCGYQSAKTIDEADIIMYNTCCVREHAEKRVFGNIGALKKRKDENPKLIIGVCGCMMQQKEVAERFFKRYPFVNLISGTHSLHRLPSLLNSVLQGDRIIFLQDIENEIIEGLPIKRIPGVSASINIMYGCDNFCSYCIVPYVRGRERSRQCTDIINEAEQLALDGYSEVLLLGQNVNSYGRGLEGQSFPGLLRKMDRVEGIKRVRFMTSHPKDLSDDLIQAIAQSEHICSHIHLPIQSGSNKVLKEMNRRYSREDYLLLVDKLRKSIPNIEITTDIIVGFPGESDHDFLDTLDIIEKIGFSAAFTFMFSPRQGTKAAQLENQIPDEIKRRRLQQLNALQELQTKITNERYIDTINEVLVEGYDFKNGNCILYGKLSNFKMVYFPGETDKIGKYISVHINNTYKNSLLGTYVPER